MARLIDADALLEMGRARKIIEVVGNWKELPGCAKSACVRIGVAHKKMILDAPTVDAVEVVRCKDCNKWYRHTVVDRERGDCRRYQATKHENGYCDRGERRTDA